MNRISKIIYYFVALFFFILFDVFISNFLQNNIDNFAENPVFDIISVQNTGAAFSILQDAKAFLITFSLAAVLWITFYIIKNINKISVFGLFWTSLLVSGIFCNMYERIVFGYVRDFFKLNFINFPVFNVSDVFINLSVFVIVVIIVKYNFSKNNETGN